MNIAVVGTGYVGLVTGTCFAELGNSVVCVDIDESKVKSLKGGKLTIYEPQLEDIFIRNAKAKRLTFTTKLADAMKSAEIIFLALPTPPNEDGSADLSYVLGVAKEVGKLIDKYIVVVNKSTVPVGTADQVRKVISAQTKKAFDVVSNPEFLREGFAIDDFMKPYRVVIGSSSARASKLMKKLYEPFAVQGNPIYFMDERSAEVTKYAANSYLAAKITFMNEIANFAEIVGADVDMVRLGVGSDDRIGKDFLFAGIGYGGSCFPKDVQALRQTGQEHGYDFKILESVMKVNSNQKKQLVNKLIKHFGNIENKKIAVWGLSFKPDTDDIREAPSITIVQELLRSGANVQAYDPAAMPNFKNLVSHKNLKFSEDHYGALKGADALLIVSEWPVFKSPDFEKMKKLLNTPTIFDGRNIYELEQMKKAGFQYVSVGRKVVDGRK